MMRAFIAADHQTFPDAPLRAMWNLVGDMCLVMNVHKDYPNKGDHHASDAKDYSRALEWVRAQRVGG